LTGFVVVGASNQKDERKTKTSGDGEANWGSNYGPTLSLLAPGILVCTTDIAGGTGYSTNDYTQTFNGTSAATPHVAATAALMLSVNPGLTAQEIDTILTSTAQKLAKQKKWTPELGHGRLDIAAAVKAASKSTPPPAPAAPDKPAKPAKGKVKDKKPAKKPAKKPK
jgi:subtilisin family serine protease